MITKIRFILFTFVLSLFFISSCEKNTVDSSNNGDDNSSTKRNALMPMNIMNQWVYDNNYEIFIISKVDIGGKTWYVDINDDYYRNDSIGLWFYVVDDSTEGLFAKYPIDVNESFIDYGGNQVTCTAKDITFDKYNGCYEYFYLNETFERKNYFQPSNGLVGYTIDGDYKEKVVLQRSVLWE